MGLFDSFDYNPTPGGSMLMGLGAGLLQASGPSLTPQGIGQGMGRGMLMGKQMYNDALQTQAIGAHADLYKAQAEKTRRLNDFLANMGGATGQSQGDVQGVAGGGVPVPPGAGGPANGGFPLSLNQVAQLKAMGGPDMLAEYKYANDGIKQEGGAYYKNPITGQVQYMPRVPEGMAMMANGAIAPLPGYIAGAAAFEGAKTGASESAKAQYDLVEVDNGKGGTKLVPRAQVVAGGAGGGVQKGRNPSDVKYEDGIATYYAEVSKNIQKAALEAQGKISRLDQLNKLLTDHNGGKLSNTGVEIAKFANSLGLNINQNLGNLEAAQALSGELALAARSTGEGGGMPGAMSDADRQFLVNMTPNLGQSKEGRETLIAAQKGVLKRQQDVAKLARTWEQRFGRLDKADANGKTFSDYLEIWRNKNPVFAGAQ